ncbi:MAG TPA: hypothetical protein VL738_10255, partial [Dactylosporangium sp.]|nr:hypothetical protein [Dactylosporangium sp.]
LRVDLAGERPHYFRVEVADGMHDVSVSTVHTGQPHDPHVIRISETTDGYEVPRVWLHEITKTLDQAAPWWHQEQQPHGLMDRMAAETHAPQARSHDPYVNGRLAERNHLLRQLGDERQSWQHDELRQDLRGLDRDLAEHGHDPHRLEQVEDPTGPEHDPHDAHWNEPRWVREGRPPSIDELIPQTKAESQRWAGAIVEHVRPLFERYEFGGFHMRLEHDLPIVAHRDSLQIRLEAVRPDGGRAGHMSFTLRRLEDGTLVAHHDHLGLTDTGERGRGFYHQLNQHLEGWYRYSGVDRVELHAAESAGGYVHAREGVDWANPGAANKMLNRLQAQVDRLAGEAAAVQHFIYVDRSTQVGHLAHEYRANDAHQLYWEIERQRAAGQAVLDRAANHPYGSREFPTPKDIADAGRPLDGDTGPERMWGGKRALLGGAWMGAKHISDGGPRFTRAEQVTAGAVEHSPTFHAHARPHPEPAVVADHGHRALAGAMQRQPEHAPLRDARVELTSASPHQRDWPGNAVARSVPIDAAGRDLPHGTVPPEGGGYRIEISDRAADAAIERAVVHEVAETNEILTRHHNGEPIHVPDALRPGAHDPGARLSPHDVGRLAERSLLQHQAGDHTLSPAQREHAAHELGLLDEHLGLTGHDEATAARHALIEAHQRPADAGTGHPPANSAIEGTRHVPDGTRLRLDEHTAYVIAAEETHPGDFGGGVRGLVRDNGLLRVDL